MCSIASLLCYTQSIGNDTYNSLRKNMLISDRQVCLLANVILAATNTLDEAAAGTISKEDLVKTMLLIESTIHGLNAEFMKYNQEPKEPTNGARN